MWRFWVVVVLWAAVVAERSAALGIPVRDPEGQMFRGRLAKALVFLVVIALVEGVVRARSRGWSLRNVARVLRERWTGQRVLLVVTGLVGYHLVYLGYRNLKSWNAFNPLRDDDLLVFDRALFLGHSPWVMLHTLLGESYAAEALAVVYRSFTYVIVLALVGSLALIPRVRQAYVFLSAATWAWILGTLCYYVLPSLGPYAAAPGRVRRPAAHPDHRHPGRVPRRAGRVPGRPVEPPTPSSASAPSRASTSASPPWSS